MSKVVTLVRVREWEQDQWSDNFLYEKEGVFEEDFRNATSEYLLTDGGKQELSHNSGCFNWGDAVMSVPDEILSKYGIKPLLTEKVSLSEHEVVTVDQDESLVV